LLSSVTNLPSSSMKKPKPTPPMIAAGERGPPAQQR
jgi:hypothetical protein